MEEPIDCVKIIIDYCKENCNKCENCEIDHICEKYFEDRVKGGKNNE